MYLLQIGLNTVKEGRCLTHKTSPLAMHLRILYNSFFFKFEIFFDLEIIKKRKKNECQCLERF